MVIKFLQVSQHCLTLGGGFFFVCLFFGCSIALDFELFKARAICGLLTFVYSEILEHYLEQNMHLKEAI